MISLAAAMAGSRGLHLAACLSLLGTASFVAWILPAATAVPDVLRVRLTRLWWISGLIALLAGMVWFALQTATIADADNLSDLRDALPLVALHTRYGRMLMLRLGLVVLATLPALTGGRSKVPLYLALAETAVALCLQGMIGHAGAMGGAVGDGLILSESLHLLAAGIWLGALMPLWISVRTLAPAQTVAICERFSPIGLACVLVLAGSGFAQALRLIGSVPALLGTRYGHIAVLKIALFLLALVLATVNRLWLTDRLAAGPADARRLLVSVGFETSIGIAIVIAAAFMASAPPAAHSTPVWPFSWQISLITIDEDPDFRREVITSLVAIGASLALVITALLWRRFRLPALAILIASVLMGAPSLKLLTVQAYPTSFQTSPTDFSAASIARGQTLFAQNCAVCHGPEGEGDGPAAAALRIKPADLTMPHLWEHTDGEMFWWLTHGIDDPEAGRREGPSGGPGSGPPSGLAMPGFEATLPADDRWALIDYVRAHNAGLAMQQETAFDVPVRAPAFAITCAAVTAANMADLRGHAVHVVAGDAVSINVPPELGIPTIGLALQDGAVPAPGSCVAADETAWRAFAVLADLPPAKLAGAEFLIDPNGWLRAVYRPGTGGGWHTRESLIAAVRGICAAPVQQPNGAQHGHHH